MLEELIEWMFSSPFLSLEDNVNQTTSTSPTIVVETSIKSIQTIASRVYSWGSHYCHALLLWGRNSRSVSPRSLELPFRGSARSNYFHNYTRCYLLFSLLFSETKMEFSINCDSKTDRSQHQMWEFPFFYSDLKEICRNVK